jgi:hypothetical protein
MINDQSKVKCVLNHAKINVKGAPLIGTGEESP